MNLKIMARFQQRQLMEKEQKLLQLYDQQQERAHQVAQRGSAGSHTSNGSIVPISMNHVVAKSTSITNSQGGKVRHMFDERRQTTVKGIDRSYPLEPLENESRKGATNSISKQIKTRQALPVKRTIRTDRNVNINHGKPVENFHEEITRETFGPKLIHRNNDDLEEFHENHVNKWTNKNYNCHSEVITNKELRMNNQGKRDEKYKYGNVKKASGNENNRCETFTLSSSDLRNGESSKTYQDMNKMKLERKSPSQNWNVEPSNCSKSCKGPHIFNISPCHNKNSQKEFSVIEPEKKSFITSNEYKNEISSELVNLSKSNNSFFNDNHDYYHPRQKSEFEKSKNLKKLEQDLDCSEENQISNNEYETFNQEKNFIVPGCYDNSSMKITDYSNNSSIPNKTRIFNKNFNSNENRFCKKNNDGEKIFYETSNELSFKRRQNQKTEYNKSKIFQKLHEELSTFPEFYSEMNSINLPWKNNIENEVIENQTTKSILLKNNEMNFFKYFPKTQEFLEPLQSVKLLRDPFLLHEKKNESSIKCRLDHVDKDSSLKDPQHEIFHEIIQKENHPHSMTKRLHESRTCKTNGAKNSIIHLGARDKIKSTSCSSNLKTQKKKNTRIVNPDCRRSSLHAPTTSWVMKTRTINKNVHKNATTPPKAQKKLTKPKHDKSTKSNGKYSSVKITTIHDRASSSPTCKKGLFLDSECDIGSKDTKYSNENTITIEKPNEEMTWRKFQKSSVVQEPLRTILRSIHDIRSSMTGNNESIEHNINEPTDNIIAPKVTIRIISPNSAQRIKQNIQIEKTAIPDDNNKKIPLSRKKDTAGATEATTNGKGFHIILRPTSKNSSQGAPKTNDACNREIKNNSKQIDTNVIKSSAFTVELDDETHLNVKTHIEKFHHGPLSEKISSSSKQEGSIARPSSKISVNSTNCTPIKSMGHSDHNKGKMATRIREISSANRTLLTPKSNTTLSNNDNLSECKICKRKFSSDRITLHEQICAKTSQKKRKTFDPVVQRVKGTELEPFVKKISKKGTDHKKMNKSKVNSNWRRKHEDFINAIRSAKQMQIHLAAGGKISDLPPPPASDTSDYVQCPHCGRKFNQAAAERHIPKCETMLHNKPNPRAKPKRS